MEWFVIIILAAFAWFWLDSMRAREIAIIAVRKFCAQQGVQLLDAAVALASIRLERDREGRLALARTYRFEFSDSGDNRLSGSLVMLGHQPGQMHVEAFNPNR